MQSNANEAKAVLTVWTDALADADADFNEWYNREHVNERSDIPGFLSGRRYRAITGRPRYMALYDTTGADVLASDAYREALDNPSPWTQRIMPSFHNMTRAVLEIRMRVGRGYGAVAASFRPATDAAAPAALGDWLTREALPRILEEPGIIGAQFLAAGGARAASGTTESGMRPEADKSVNWALIVEGTEPDLVRAACRATLPREALRRHGAGLRVRRGLYRLLYGTGR